MLRGATIVVIAFAGGALALALCTELFRNSWQLLTDGGAGGFFVPAESSIFSFRETQSNPGSGGWWILGEDRASFYAVEPEGPGYLVFPKVAVASCPGFNPMDSASWCLAVAKRGQHE
jgi:hypothetical protein